MYNITYCSATHAEAGAGAGAVNLSILHFIFIVTIIFFIILHFKCMRWQLEKRKNIIHHVIVRQSMMECRTSLIHVALVLCLEAKVFVKKWSNPPSYGLGLFSLLNLILIGWCLLDYDCAISTVYRLPPAPTAADNDALQPLGCTVLDARGVDEPTCIL